LDTDYESWASVFTCSEARPEGNSYILFRESNELARMHLRGIILPSDKNINFPKALKTTL
jgi:hypothetical protein